MYDLRTKNEITDFTHYTVPLGSFRYRTKTQDYTLIDPELNRVYDFSETLIVGTRYCTHSIYRTIPYLPFTRFNKLSLIPGKYDEYYGKIIPRRLNLAKSNKLISLFSLKDKEDEDICLYPEDRHKEMATKMYMNLLTHYESNGVQLTSNAYAAHYYLLNYFIDYETSARVHALYKNFCKYMKFHQLEYYIEAHPDQDKLKKAIENLNK